MPWAPGKSGNPGGRPKMSPEERKEWEALAIASREKMKVILAKEDAAPQIVTRIAEISANRAWGTPPQSVELTGEDGGPIQHYNLTLEEKEKLIADEIARRSNG